MPQRQRVMAESEGRNRFCLFFHKFFCRHKLLLYSNVLLELLGPTLDQALSSTRKHKPLFALLTVVLSTLLVLISLIDLVSMVMWKRVVWVKSGVIPWFYYRYPNSKPYVPVVDIFGLVCGIIQCILEWVAFIYVCIRHADVSPIKMSVFWPFTFAFLMLVSKLCGDHGIEVKGVKEFTYYQLAPATCGFSLANLIGKGRYGVVYGGKLSDGRKVLIVRGRSEKDFRTEFEILSKLHHRHLLGLAGFCVHRDENLLVYDNAENLTSLYDYLQDPKDDSWERRIKIALDASRGIEYLHHFANPRTFHWHINSSNILLDDGWTAKIAHFGLSLLDADIASLIDPQYSSLGPQSNVYNFGVVLVELLTGKKAAFINDGVEINIVDFAVPKIRTEDFEQILDRRVGQLDNYTVEKLRQVADTACRCVDLGREDRPTMIEVADKLLAVYEDLREVIHLCSTDLASPIGKFNLVHLDAVNLIA